MAKKKTQPPTGLSPIIKWPGGKEKELKYIFSNAPAFNRYFEPFVGGGSVFMGVNAKEYFINDFSSELIELYRNIGSSDKDFYRYVEVMDLAWAKSLDFFKSNPQLVDIYLGYRNEQIGKKELQEFVKTFCINKSKEILDIIGQEFAKLPSILVQEMGKNLFRKMTRIRELEIEKNLLPEEDLNDNIETAIKSAVYMNYRFLYNDLSIAENNPKLHCALFYFIRNYAYSGMFRYSSTGEFNVPYGGIAYNSKMMNKKLNYYQNKVQPKEDDFVFLDPP